MTWLSGFGPEIRWQVVIARKRTEDPNENPRGAEVSPYSAEGLFYWHSDPATPTRIQPP